jgi:hypothetical protein
LAASVSAGLASARLAAEVMSSRSNGLGTYSKAPTSAAFTAVIRLFCALMTMTGSLGRCFLIRGKTLKTFSSGITTSVTTRSPSPSVTHFSKVAALPVART